ncbi:MAG: ABC transporter ATP-binding protein [Bacillota bacterium]|nr:ABC transporter ATP-binding protein [Bacillota bacterium]
MLKVEKLTKRFGGLTAVNRVDLTVEEGKITAIIGPNGAGKTTFFNLISGFHTPTSGKITFNNQDITTLPPDEIAKIGIARTFQTTHLFVKSTVIDNVIIGNRLRTKSGLWDAIFRTKLMKNEEKKCMEKALEVLDFVGLTHLAKMPVGGISQEAQKKVAFALALATEPKMLLLDEPAAGVNPEETEGLAEIIQKMVAKGLTICLIEHKMKMIMNLADKIMVLNHGSKIAEGTPSEIKNNQAVIEAYLGGNASAKAI